MTPFLRVLERHVGSDATPLSTQPHIEDMDANGLLVSRRKPLANIESSQRPRDTCRLKGGPAGRYPARRR